MMPGVLKKNTIRDSLAPNALKPFKSFVKRFLDHPG